MNFISLHEMISVLERQGPAVGLFLMGAGLAFLLMGFRIFNAIVAISFAVVGFVAGASLIDSDVWGLVAGFGAAIVLALASALVTKLSVALLAGGWSGLAVIALASRLGFAGTLVLAVAVVALAVVVSLTFIMYDEIIALVTSFEGALLFLAGLVVILSLSPTVWRLTRSLLTENMLFLPFLMLAGTVAGSCFQLAELREKRSGSAG